MQDTCVLVCVCLASHSIAFDLRVPDRERALRGRGCQRGKMDAGLLHGVPSHCDVVPSTPNAVVPRLSFRLHRLDSEPMAHRPTAQTLAALHLVRNDPHLVQRPCRDLAYIIREVFPGGALRVAGGHTLPVPQVTIFIYSVD